MGDCRLHEKPMREDSAHSGDQGNPLTISVSKSIAFVIHERIVSL